MPKIHLICRNPLYLNAIEPPEYESGYWTLYEAEAARLVNGELYLHQKKAEPSYFGGKILSFRLSTDTEPYPGKIVFKVAAQDEYKGLPWEGDKHPMAWMGGILD